MTAKPAGDRATATVLIPGTGSCRKHAGMTAAQARERARRTSPGFTPGRRWRSTRAPRCCGSWATRLRWSRSCGAKVSELAGQPGPDGEPGSGLFWGVTVERDRDGVIERERKAGPHAILRAMNEEAEHMIRTAAAARSTGAMEAQATAARQLAAGLTRLVDTILDGLQLTALSAGRAGPGHRAGGDPGAGPSGARRRRRERPQGVPGGLAALAEAQAAPGPRPPIRCHRDGDVNPGVGAGGGDSARRPPGRARAGLSWAPGAGRNTMEGRGVLRGPVGG